MGTYDNENQSGVTPPKNDLNLGLDIFLDSTHQLEVKVAK